MGKTRWKNLLLSMLLVLLVVGMLLYIKAVSYTHLEVYKRQILKSAPRQTLRPGLAFPRCRCPGWRNGF